MSGQRGVGQPERHRTARQGPGTGAGPWRARPAAGAAFPVRAVISSQKSQPPAAFPYLATLTEHLTALIEHQDRRSVVRVRGELDIGSQAHLRRAIGAVLNRRNPRLLVLDLSELSFIDCSGLSAILWAHRRQAEKGRKLIITNVQPKVRRVLRLTSCDTLLHLSVP